MKIRPLAPCATIVLAAAATTLAAMSLAPAAHAGTCLGYCGNNIGAHGSVGGSPAGSERFGFVSTHAGQSGKGQLPGMGGTNGSQFSTWQFDGSGTLSVYFNYLTTDGFNQPDYAWSRLRRPGFSDSDILFAARTTPTGVEFIDEGLPPPQATITQITGGGLMGPVAGPEFLPLGSSSQFCGFPGCATSGWQRADIELSGGLYILDLGVTNVTDLRYDSALAFDLRLNGEPIDWLHFADAASLPVETLDNGAFRFHFDAEPNQGIFIDPPMATGYDYQTNAGPWITKAMFPILPGDPDGYDVYSLEDPDLFLAHVAGGELLDFTALGFADGIAGFRLRGIHPNAGVDPTDPTAFVTQLFFAGRGMVDMLQTPITSAAAVPEPGAWALMLTGFFAAGGAIRSRRRNAHA